MSKLGRFWDWLLPELICLCPMGAVAFYDARAEAAVPHQDLASTRRPDLDSHALMGAAVISIARP
jgi:hypothetical protein